MRQNDDALTVQLLHCSPPSERRAWSHGPSESGVEASECDVPAPLAALLGAAPENRCYFATPSLSMTFPAPACGLEKIPGNFLGHHHGSA